MKANTIKFPILLLMMVLVKASAENCEFSYETLSHETILQSDRYKKLVKFEPGYHKTIVRISNLPVAESYVLKWQRPLLNKKEHREEWTKEFFSKVSEFLEEDEPVFFISSKGFLPGEKVIFSLETIGGIAIGQPFELFPQPLIQEMRSGKSKLIAELSILSPSRYEITLEGIPSFETLEVCSCSLDEKIETEFVYRQGFCIGHMPGVIGKAGGVCNFSITRQRGDKFQISLPWGEELKKHVSGESKPVVSDFTTITGKSKKV